ncbi:MAG: hypothetical protein ACKOFW_07185, partial [Planctomycetaceae bacterium]
DEIPLFLGSDTGTVAVVYNATGQEVRGMPGGATFLTLLAPEKWTPQLPSDPMIVGPIWPAWQTRLLPTKLPDLPADPLLYTACDVLLLTGGNLAELRPDQRGAIEPWLAAGGVLALVLSPASLRSESLAWLNRIAVGEGEGWLEPDPVTGLVQLPAGESLRLSRYGLGRVAIFAADPAGDLADRQRLATALPFLWGWNAEQSAEFRASPEWRPGLSDASLHGELFWPQTWENPTAPPYFPIASIRQRFLPADMRPLSLAIMACLMGAYVLLIGPLDYLLLGRWKARRWTWITFPAITLLITFSLVTLSNLQLSGMEHGPALLLIDLDGGNRPVRVTRLECQIASREQLLTRSIQRGWISTESYSPNTEIVPRFRLQPGREQVVDVEVPQWSPRLIRETWLPQPWTGEGATGPQIPDCPVDFGSLAAKLSGELSFNEKLQRTREWLGSSAGDVARVDLFLGDKVEMLSGNRRDVVRLPIVELTRWGPEMTPPNNDQTLKPFERRLPAVRRSPAPGGDLRDLRLHDTTNPQSCLLTVVTQAPNGEFVVWRKTIAGD